MQKISADTKIAKLRCAATESPSIGGINTIMRNAANARRMPHSADFLFLSLLMIIITFRFLFFVLDVTYSVLRITGGVQFTF